jgi:ferric iron reductase protein FhuF
MPPVSYAVDILPTQFHIVFQEENDASFMLLSGRELLKQEVCLRLLQECSERMKVNSLTVVASQFAKHYSFTVVVPALYAMSALNERLDFSPDNVRIQTTWQHQQLNMQLQLRDWKAQPMGEKNRKFLREQLLTSLFTHHIAPLWQQLHRLTGIPLSILWENLAGYIYWLYEAKLKEDDRVNPSLAQDDFHYLLSGAEAGLFREKVQPIGRFYAGAQAGVRKTCCLYYLASEDQVCCQNCPRLQQRGPAGG